MNAVDTWRFSSALALTFGSFYVLCAIAYAIWPLPTLGFFNAWFHGLDFSLLVTESGEPWTFGRFVYGLFSVMVTAFVLGLIFSGFSYLIKRGP